MKIGRRGHAACVLQDKIYVVGGINAEKNYVKEIECYDPDTKAWETCGSIIEKLQCHLLIISWKKKLSCKGPLPGPTIYYCFS